MTSQSTNTNWWYRLNQKIASSRAGAKVYSLMAHYFDRGMLRLTNGRTTLGELLTGVPIITLTAIGAKSGKPRSVPLVGIPDGDNIILIASNWGGKEHPAWYFNIKAHPEAQVTIGQETKTYLAEEVTGAERDRCWQKAVNIYPGYTAYEQRTGSRTIPVLLLKPQATS